MTLIDSNIIIYAAQPQYSNLRLFIAENAPAVSAVSYVEVLGYPRLTLEERQYFEAFFASATILSISDGVIHEAIRLRQTEKNDSRRCAGRGNCLASRSDVGHA